MLIDETKRLWPASESGTLHSPIQMGDGPLAPVQPIPPGLFLRRVRISRPQQHRQNEEEDLGLLPGAAVLGLDHLDRTNFRPLAISESKLDEIQRTIQVWPDFT